MSVSGATGHLPQVTLNSNYGYTASVDNLAEEILGDGMVTQKEFERVAKGDGDKNTLSSADLAAAGFTGADAVKMANAFKAMRDSGFSAIGVEFDSGVIDSTAEAGRQAVTLISEMGHFTAEAASGDHHRLAAAAERLEHTLRAMAGDNFATGMAAGVTEELGHMVNSIAGLPPAQKAIAIVVTVGLIAANSCPPAAAAINGALALYAGATTVKQIASAVQKFMHGDSFGGGREMGRAAVNAAMAVLAGSHAVHAVGHMGKVAHGAAAAHATTKAATVAEVATGAAADAGIVARVAVGSGEAVAGAARASDTAATVGRVAEIGEAAKTVAGAGVHGGEVTAKADKAIGGGHH